MLGELLFMVLLPLEVLLAALLMVASVFLPASQLDLLVLSGLLLSGLALPATLQARRADEDDGLTDELLRASSVPSRLLVSRLAVPATLLAGLVALIRLVLWRDLPSLLAMGMILVLFGLVSGLLTMLRARAPIPGVDYL